MTLLTQETGGHGAGPCACGCSCAADGASHWLDEACLCIEQQCPCVTDELREPEPSPDAGDSGLMHIPEPRKLGDSLTGSQTPAPDPPATPEEVRARGAYERIRHDLLEATGQATLAWEELTLEAGTSSS